MKARTLLWPLLAVLAGTALAAAALPGGDALPKKVNLNTATVEELVRLPGIGPALARRIVEHREKNGPFRKVEELLIVRGISRKKFEKLRPLLTVEPQVPPGEGKPASGRRAPTPSRPQ